MCDWCYNTSYIHSDSVCVPCCVVNRPVYCSPCCSSQCCCSRQGCCLPNSHCSIGIDQQPRVNKCGWQVILDVSNFESEDISVSAENNMIIVHAKKKLLCGYNGFTRKYELPKEFNLDGVTVCFSSDGILLITVPSIQYRNYTIQTCGPARCFIPCKNNTSF